MICFGVVDGVFKFCGYLIKQTNNGVTITSPGVLDRAKAIFIEPLRRKQRGLPATPAEIAQLTFCGWKPELVQPCLQT